MTANVRSWFYLMDPERQIFTADMLATAVFIEDSKAWSMGYQEVCICWNHVPMPPNGITSVSIKRPIKKPRRNGRSPDPEIPNYKAAVLQINYVTGNDFGNFIVRAFLKIKIMVTCYENLVPIV